MSMFWCNGCGNLIDGDYDGCHADPTDDMELLCDECLTEHCCEYCSDPMSPGDRKSGMHRECWKEYVAEKRAQQRKDDQLTGDRA